MPLGTEVDLGPDYIVLNGDPSPPGERGIAAPLFLAHVCCGHGCPSQLLLSSCTNGRPKTTYPNFKNFSVHVACGHTLSSCDDSAVHYVLPVL